MNPINPGCGRRITAGRGMSCRRQYILLANCSFRITILFKKLMRIFTLTLLFLVSAFGIADSQWTKIYQTDSCIDFLASQEKSPFGMTLILMGSDSLFHSNRLR
jgi:hypothetical protein